MKLRTVAALGIIVLSLSSAASAQSQYPWYYIFQGEEGKFQSQINDDLFQVKQGVLNADIKIGSAAATIAAEKARVGKEIVEAYSRVSTLAPKLRGVEKHFNTLREVILKGGRATVSMDDPDELEAFCSSNDIGDLSILSQREVVVKTYEDAAKGMDAIKTRLDPISGTMYAENTSWAPATVSGPAGVDADSPVAKQYRADQLAAQQKAHDANVRAQQKIWSAATHAGWAAYRLRQVEAKTLAQFDEAKKQNVTANNYLVNKGANQQNRCANIVKVLRELRTVAGSTSALAAAKGLTTDAK
jgi:hypothetical protein